MTKLISLKKKTLLDGCQCAPIQWPWILTSVMYKHRKTDVFSKGRSEPWNIMHDVIRWGVWSGPTDWINSWLHGLSYTVYFNVCWLWIGKCINIHVFCNFSLFTVYGAAPGFVLSTLYSMSLLFGLKLPFGDFIKIKQFCFVYHKNALYWPLRHSKQSCSHLIQLL